MMMMMITSLLLLPLVSALAIQRRSTTLCGQYESTTWGSYTLFTNLWGEGGATSGWQCSTLESLNGNDVAWYTSWDWSGGTGIKSYSNIQQNYGVNQQLSAITSMPSTWDWSLDNTGVKADVAYDCFTASTAGGSAENEIMIWLANFNSGPISYNYYSDGYAVPVATYLNIAGYIWNLYVGSNGSNKVFSYVLVTGTANTFNGDIYGFFTYLIDNGYIGSWQYLTIAQAGTEVTSGSATLTTSSYSLAIN